MVKMVMDPEFGVEVPDPDAAPDPYSVQEPEGTYGVFDETEERWVAHGLSRAATVQVLAQREVPPEFIELDLRGADQGVRIRWGNELDEGAPEDARWLDCWAGIVQRHGVAEAALHWRAQGRDSADFQVLCDRIQREHERLTPAPVTPGAYPDPDKSPGPLDELLED